MPVRKREANMRTEHLLNPSGGTTDRPGDLKSARCNPSFRTRGGAMETKHIDCQMRRPMRMLHLVV